MKTKEEWLRYERCNYSNDVADKLYELEQRAEKAEEVIEAWKYGSAFPQADKNDIYTRFKALQKVAEAAQLHRQPPITEDNYWKNSRALDKALAELDKLK